ncbi:MAG: hypothetical protein JWP89_2643 [Schlesneria sp.]|nr:hypothetical protein [Schlesneria sp.]
MRLTWRRFEVYLDAFSWLLQEESEDGRKKNRLWDLRAMREEPRMKDWKNSEREKANRALAKIRKPPVV